MLKSNAIVEGKLKITDIKLISKLSDNVKFIEQIETAVNGIPQDGWWNTIEPHLYSKSQDKKEKIVKLVKDPWNELHLSWKEKKSKSSEVVFSSKVDKPK